jgi:hypothetical protein
MKPSSSSLLFFLKEKNGGNVAAATKIGAEIAKAAKKAKVTKIAFDRSGFKYQTKNTTSFNYFYNTTNINQLFNEAIIIVFIIFSKIRTLQITLANFHWPAKINMMLMQRRRLIRHL